MFTGRQLVKFSRLAVAVMGMLLTVVWLALVYSGHIQAQSVAVPNTPIIESAHPYANNENAHWVINNNSGQNAARIFFSRIELENGVDKIEIRDQNDTLIQEITTSAPDGMWSDVVPGTLVKVALRSDGSGRFWGFAVEQIEYLNYTTVGYSPHPYPNNHNNVRIFVNPAPSPIGTRLRFDRIELEQDVDYLIILDADDNPYQWITGNHLSGFTSKAVPGAAIKLQLVSDDSVQRWGYNIDAIQTAPPDAPDPQPTFPVTLAESDHPYPPNIDQVWTIVNPDTNAVSSKIHFSRIDISHNDILQVLDANDTVIQTFSANTHLTDVWSDYVPGRIVKVRLTTSATYQDWGFRVDAIVDSVPNPGLAQSHHPYPPNLTQEWTVVNPNVNAVSSKIHFSRIDISHSDTLQVLDANDTVIQTFSANTYLTDVWSDYVPGRIVKVRLTTSATYQDWGFRVDDIYPASEEPIPRAYVSGIYITVLYPGRVYLNGLEVANAQEPGDYRILLPGMGNYTIHIVYQEYTQDIVVTVDGNGGVHITYLPLVIRE